MPDGKASDRDAEPKHGRGDSSGRPSRRAGIESMIVSMRSGGRFSGAGHHWGVDGSRADRVDADATVGVFQGCAPGQAEDAVLDAV